MPVIILAMTYFVTSICHYFLCAITSGVIEFLQSALYNRATCVRISDDACYQSVSGAL